MLGAIGGKISRSKILSPLALVVFAGLALRIAILWWRSGHDPFYQQTINDAEVYLGWARALMNGSFFGIPGAPYHLAPLYSRFLTWILPLGGGQLGAVAMAQAVLGSATILGTGLLARRVAGAQADDRFSERAGWLAALLLTLCAPLVWYEGWLLPTSLNLFLLVVGLNLLVACGDPRRKGIWLPLLCGLVLGLAAVNRPQQLLFLAGGLGWLVLQLRKSPEAGHLIRRWRPVIVMALGAAAAIAPVTIHNISISGEPVLITASGGLNFYLGNRAGSDGRFGMPDGFSPYVQDQQKFSHDLARSRSGEDLDWQGVSGYWLGQARSDITGNPGAALTLVARKAWLFFSWRELENNFVASWVHRQLGPGLVLIPSLGFLWILAVPGMIASARRKISAQGPLWILLGCTLLTCLLFWVSTRNRLPAAIPLAVFAGIALANPKSWLRPPTVLVAAALAAVVSAMVFWPTGESAEGAGFYVDLGRIHAQAGEHLTAREDFQLALEIDPNTPMAINGLALTYMEEGNKSRAIAILEDLLVRYPDFEFARRNLEAIRRSGAPRPRPGTR
jgi:Tetratricopeptide repeat